MDHNFKDLVITLLTPEQDGRRRPKPNWGHFCFNHEQDYQVRRKMTETNCVSFLDIPSRLFNLSLKFVVVVAKTEALASLQSVVSVVSLFVSLD